MKKYRYELLSFLILMAGVLATYFRLECFEVEYTRLVWYLLALLPVGLPVLRETIESLRERDFANEFMLMSLAAIGAFCIGEYPEGVAVMLFYTVGEKLQDGTVDKARDNIRALLDMRPQTAVVWREGSLKTVVPEEVEPGETIEVKTGERVPLDGKLQGESVLLNTAALTGESIPRLASEGDEILAGMIPSDHTIRLIVSRRAEESALARVLQMVEEASERKAPTEIFMRRIARIYTPVVMSIALCIFIIPYIYSLFQRVFVFEAGEWLYRSLVFLVISCPCALVISIPLGYFAGIGAASRRGILFKGGNWLDAVTRVDTVVFDKTGTLTTGRFRLERVEGILPEADVLRLIASVESASNHPMAKAVVAYARKEGMALFPIESPKELAGYGLEAMIEGRQTLVGNFRLLEKYGINYPAGLCEVTESLILCAQGGRYIGCVRLTDELKDDAIRAIQDLRHQGVSRVEILSGDKDALVQSIARRLGVDKAYGDRLPAGKIERLQVLREEGRRTAFVGDGINDAPVLAISDVGVAMGALGSDVAIETADIVLQNDCPSSLVEAIKIGRYTRRVVWQNIIFAFTVKAVVLALGLAGIATLWEAVFTDSGVALLAVCNVLRIGRAV